MIKTSLIALGCVAFSGAELALAKDLDVTLVAPGVYVSTRGNQKYVDFRDATGTNIAEGISKTSSVFTVRFTPEAKAVFEKAKLSGIYSGLTWFRCIELLVADITSSDLAPKKHIEIRRQKEDGKIVLCFRVLDVPKSHWGQL